MGSGAGLGATTLSETSKPGMPGYLLGAGMITSITRPSALSEPLERVRVEDG